MYTLGGINPRRKTKDRRRIRTRRRRRRRRRKRKRKREREFETFRIGVMLEQARLERGLTQEQLAQLCGTKKSYISRIENNASDIRLTTLMNIVEKGLGGKL
jgi:HTH-type transcriptional regulator / antitoxin HipB